MTKIQDIHPTLCHSMDVTVQILRSAILYRQREIADFEAAIKACQTVRAEEATFRPEAEPEDLARLSETMEKAVADELEKPTISSPPPTARRLAAFRQAAREGNGVDSAQDHR